MSAEPQPGRRTARMLRRFVTRGALTVVGVVVGLFCYFVCQGMFAGYPRYHTGELSIVGMVLIALTGGAAWIVDERRISDDS